MIKSIDLSLFDPQPELEPELESYSEKMSELESSSNFRFRNPAARYL